jgi:hypothetical protein
MKLAHTAQAKADAVANDANYAASAAVGHLRAKVGSSLMRLAVA